MFKAKFTKIKDISEIRRLPRLGKIKLGVKLISHRTNREYPKETEYFIVPPEVAKVYGERPTSLEVMFPVNDIETVFPQAYKWYGGQRGLKCIGNGEKALRLDEKTLEMNEIECDGDICEKMKKGECQRIGHLMVILPRVNIGGVYQINIGSYHSIVDVNSGLEYVQALVGRFAMVPLRLCRTPKETHFGGQKQIHYTIQIFLDADVELLNTLRENTQRVLLSTRNLALPPPEAETIAEEAETIAEEDVVIEESDSSITTSEEEKERIKTSSNSPEEGNKSGKIEPLQLLAIEKLSQKKGINYSEKAVKTLSYKGAQLLISALQQNYLDPGELQKKFPGVIM